MRKGFYGKLAITNIRKNHRTYIPYILTCIITVMMFYIIHSISINESVQTSVSLASTMKMAADITAVFSVIFLFYTNSFLIRKRKREIGLYNILGLEKRHIGRMLGMETLITSAVSIVSGLLLGMAFSKLLFMFLLKMIQIPVNMAFAVEKVSAIGTGKLFAVIFLLTFFCDLWQIKSSSPIELLQGSNVGEREPKTKILLTVFGLVTLGTGYAIALLTRSPLTALGNFFIAVILVILGTYALFTAGSIALLKLLRRNKKFYYQTRHFTAVSGMMYRMKQNAAGLATICILSTIVLVMLSCSCSLYFGMRDVLYNRFPGEVKVVSRAFTEESEQKLRGDIDQILNENGLARTWTAGFHRVSMTVQETLENGFTAGLSEEGTSAFSPSLILVPVEELNALTGENYQLQPDEIIFYTTEKELYGKTEIQLNGRSFRVKKELDDLQIDRKSANGASVDYYFFTADADIIRELSGTSATAFLYEFELQGSEKQIEAAEKEITGLLNGEMADGSYNYVECRTLSKAGFYGTYGGILFIGVFLGILFVMATVLIMYYKQITEGYEDKERYAIMKKVGMSTREIRQSIRSQILIVFFLPLLMAILHITVAFPVITKLLGILNLTNVPLFLVTTIITVCVFAVMYIIVFALTAREYYRIVR